MSDLPQQDKETMKKFFPVDERSPDEYLLKRGCQRVYEYSNSKYDIGNDKIRAAIVNTLGRLKKIKAHSFADCKHKPQVQDLSFVLFSSNEGTLVDTYVNQVTGKMQAQAYEMNDLPNPKTTLTTKQLMNLTFRRDLETYLESNYENDIEDLIFAGVSYVLSKGDDLEGPTVEGFEAQKELFGKLMHIYTNSWNIDSSKGDFSDAIAVDAFFERGLEIGKGEDDFRYEG